LVGLYSEKGAPLLYQIYLSAYKLRWVFFNQIQNKIGSDAQRGYQCLHFVKNTLIHSTLIKEGQILAGHDVASERLITTLLKWCFA